MAAKPKPDDREQSRRFVETARAIEADEESSAADGLLGRLAKQAPEPGKNRRSEMTGRVLTIAAAAILWSVPGLADPTDMRITQLPRYSASGAHQCRSASGGERNCVVTGLFRDCNEAMITLQTRDCCPTTRGGEKSSGFTLNYCIPDMSR
ncbi:MAG: hypothetical protein WAK63_09340 [Xanthobacteraceae bacterium]